MKTDTHGGIIMCSEFCAMQSFTKYNSVMQTITIKYFRHTICQRKAFTTTINTAKIQSKRKISVNGDVAGANDWTVFFVLLLLKELIHQ